MLKRALKLILCTICILSVLKSAKEFRDAESALEAQMNLSERDEAAADRIAVLNAARKVMEGGAEEDIDTVVADYFALIRAGYKGEKPKHVELSPDDAYLIQIDGQAYDRTC
ncbi:MAG: hypothetical protein Q4F18_04890 [Clostridia bacterium]|nr:hypothetical protein [Clostridia bacterium]